MTEVSISSTSSSAAISLRTACRRVMLSAKAALCELGETLSEQEDHVETLIAERPIATMASAFALGVVIGFMLRRH